MNTTKEQRKEKAVEIMKQIGIYKPYIDGFVKHDHVCFYENFAGFWAWQNEELNNKIREIERKHNCTVYGITHEFTEFGELYDFLIVTDYIEEWNTLTIRNTKYSFYSFSFVWNKTDEWCSEFGTIEIETFSGGIRRIS